MHPTLRHTVLLVLFGLGLMLSKAFAQHAQMLEMLKGMKLDRAQIESALQQLEKQGIVSKDEAEKARNKLSGMSDGDIDKLKTQAIDKVQKGEVPAESLKAAEGMKQGQSAAPSPQVQPRRPSSFNLNNYK
ncbi:MAG: hypothetical protein Fur0010_26270 [Bdellovibrio sp.]